MKNKADKQSKLIRFITLPIRVLGKARDFYVRSLTDYAGRVSYGSCGMGGATEQFSFMSRSKSTTSSSSMGNESDDLRELIRAASAKYLGDRIDVNMILHQQQKQQSKGILPKSCSVGMSRIDEDFEEDDVHENNDLVYPRRKSYAVTKTINY